jgi:hypothetical protein
MHEGYYDITSRISAPPLWWDENGCPRYEPFDVEFCPDIYARTVILLRIACQACAREFDVQLSYGIFTTTIDNPKHAHYGDPPRHDGCMGDSMNCEDLEVLQVWHRDRLDWVRHEDLEGLIEEGEDVR